MTFSSLIKGTVPHHNKYQDRSGAKVTRVIQHHWAGISGGDARLTDPDQAASCTYLVYSNGDILGQVPEEYRPWTSSSYEADAPSITIECQNSSLSPEWRISKAAEASIIALLADIAERYSWGSVEAENYRGHLEFKSTSCPGPYLWGRMPFLRESAKALLLGLEPPEPPIEEPIVAKAYNPTSSFYISSNYGPRDGGFHAGTDYRPHAGVGAPAYAIYGGVIEDIVRGRVNDRSSDQKLNVGKPVLAPARTGNGPKIRCDDGEVVLLVHVDVPLSLKKGDRVAAGQYMGKVDLSGNSSGPHVHAEIWRNASSSSHTDVAARLKYHASRGELGNATGTGSFLPLRIDGDFGHRSITELERALAKTGDYKGLIEEDRGELAVFGPVLWGALHQFLSRHKYEASKKGLQTFLKDLLLYNYDIDGLMPDGGETWKAFQLALNAVDIRNNRVSHTPEPEPQPNPEPEPTPEPEPEPVPEPTPEPQPVPDSALTAKEIANAVVDELSRRLNQPN